MNNSTINQSASKNNRLGCAVDRARTVRTSHRYITTGRLSGKRRATTSSFTRPNVYGKLPDEALEYVTQIAGKTIYVFLVRLGHLFEEPQRTTSG